MLSVVYFFIIFYYIIPHWTICPVGNNIVYCLFSCLLSAQKTSVVYCLFCCLLFILKMSIVHCYSVVCCMSRRRLLRVVYSEKVCCLLVKLYVTCFFQISCYLLPFILLVSPYVCYLSFVHICCLLTVHMCVVNVLLRRRMSMFVQKTFFFRRVSWTWSSYFFVVYKVCFVYCLFRTHLLCPVVNTTSVICSYSVNPCYMF